MYSIQRHLAATIEKRFSHNKAILVSGPRQTGKSTMCSYLFPKANHVNLDNVLVRSQATDDPNLFLKNNPPPLFFDEIQKCPSLLESIKGYMEDHPDEKSLFILTGSQKLRIMAGVSESLAGRVSINELQGLSLREIENVTFTKHFVPTQEYLEEREKNIKPYHDIWERIHRGSFPELYADTHKEWMDFYQSYVSTYLERDVNELLKIGNYLTFAKFMVSVAARTGQILNYSNIASEVGVDIKTIQAWLSILERSGLVYLLKPYSSSALFRATKSPKLYFRDTGLACYLTRWLTTDTLKNGAMSGAMFETFVIDEILKSYSNEGTNFDFSVFFYQGKDKKKIKIGNIEESVEGEIDLIIEENGILYPVEIKETENPKATMASEFDVLDKVPGKKRGTGVIICSYGKKLYLRENLVALPLEYI